MEKGFFELTSAECPPVVRPPCRPPLAGPASAPQSPSPALGCTFPGGPAGCRQSCWTGRNATAASVHPFPAGWAGRWDHGTSTATSGPTATAAHPRPAPSAAAGRPRRTVRATSHPPSLHAHVQLSPYTHLLLLRKNMNDAGKFQHGDFIFRCNYTLQLWSKCFLCPPPYPSDWLERKTKVNFRLVGVRQSKTIHLVLGGVRKGLQRFVVVFHFFTIRRISSPVKFPEFST